MILPFIATLGLIISAIYLVTAYQLEAKTIDLDIMLFTAGLSCLGWLLAFIMSARFTELKRELRNED